MKEKEKRIIEAAMSLFAKKGVTSTSIQDIANECEISKGSFYLYFKSKEALLLETFKYHFELIHSKMEAVKEKDLEPRALLIAQLSCQLSEINKHKDFIIMQMRENAIPNNPSMAAFIQKMNADSNLFVKNALLSIYGDAIKEYIWDVSMILQGMIHSYLKFIIFEKAELDFDELAAFLLNRVDDIAAGLKSSQEKPILSGEGEKNIFSICSGISHDEILAKIEHIKHQLSGDLQVTLEVIEAEMKEDSPRIPVIKGMLANLNQDSALAELQQSIAAYYQIKLL
ncbi:TetR/AcrR family transcriptional regulator [Metabacillus idriensis]|uniref:TetR family transcriptional regulator n=1 Tax=Metabacillus idriensis TaxID=324768 RepID=A0A6I2MGY2_9BACI|nr:TetR/AcrR family transcriptional regulator [Metabacillus idriensis]MCM3597820.1 TetR/AcrR family transcriptional regulator [Metabacillus idriensis]MRX56306.1 TetR family transcriptional regulator [Metabacillus idriensis]OHR70639.1 TetR family transcriptional regulator [Bacillus sp. HMSC76G11]